MSNDNEPRKLVNLWEMSKVETIEEFYQRKFDWIPDNIRNEIGHFNVFQHEPVEPGKTKTLPYKRRDFYKIMFEEINSDYIHKYDVLRNLVFELLHFGMKIQPATKFDKQPINASQRISTLFLELLERQFPIDENHQTVSLRAASDYANQLNIHVNHLNRAIKVTTEKTTSQIIAERILQEAKILLKHSAWTVSDIAYALGFTEVTHFNNFFKKHIQLSPLKFRNI
jgi:AraC family transcriptional activator of pobA